MAALHSRNRETKESGPTWPHSKARTRNKRKRPYMAALQRETEKQKWPYMAALQSEDQKQKKRPYMAAVQIRSKPDNSRKVLFRCGCSKIQMMWALVPAEGFRHAPATDCNRLQHAKKVSSAARSLWHGSSFGRGPIADCSRATGGRVPKCPKMSQVSKDRFLLPRSRSARGTYNDLPSRSARGTYNDLVSRSARGTYLALHQFAPFCTQNVWKLSSGRRSRFRFIALRAGSAQRKVTERNAMK